MVVVMIPYGQLVMEAKDAFALAEIYARSEAYKENWRSTEKGGTTHHVYPNEATVDMKVITDDLYRMAKLAGKPERE